MHVAAELGISGSALIKICNAMNIPTPPRGFWTQKSFGYRVSATPLPPETPDTMVGWTLQPEIAERLRRNHAQQVDLEEKANKIVLSTRRENEADVESFIKPTELLHAQHCDSHRGIPPGLGAFNVRVSPRMIGRAIAFLRTLLIQALNHGVSIHRAPIQRDQRRKHGKAMNCSGQPFCWLVANSGKVDLSIREKYRVKQLSEAGLPTWPYRDHVGAGHLEVTIGGKVWRDGKTRKVEDLVTEMIVALLERGTLTAVQESEANERRRIAVLQERERLVRAREQQRMEQARRTEMAAVRKLIDSARGHRRASILRSYIAKIASQFPQNECMDEKAAEWLAWAMAHADRIDPLAGEDPPWEQETYILYLNVRGKLAPVLQQEER